MGLGKLLASKTWHLSSLANDKAGFWQGTGCAPPLPCGRKSWLPALSTQAAQRTPVPIHADYFVSLTSLCNCSDLNLCSRELMEGFVYIEQGLFLQIQRGDGEITNWSVHPTDAEQRTNNSTSAETLSRWEMKKWLDDRLGIGSGGKHLTPEHHARQERITRCGRQKFD